MSELTFNINGEDVVVPILSIYALKKAWPVILSLPTRTDRIAQIEGQIEILSAALSLTRPEITPDFLARSMTLKQQDELDILILNLLRSSGLYAAKEDQDLGDPGTQGSPSMETGTVSSQDSSQPA